MNDLLRDILAFLIQPEHEIVNTYSEDYDKVSIYCGLALGWEHERDALVTRIKRELQQRPPVVTATTAAGTRAWRSGMEPGR